MSKEYIPYQDIESGEWTYIEKEIYDQIISARKQMLSNLNLKSKPMIFGTGSDDNEDLKNLFYDNDKL